MAKPQPQTTEKLCEQLSVWAKIELNHDISQEALSPLFLNPQVGKIWAHVIKNVYAVTPTQSYMEKLSAVAEPPSPELKAEHKRLLNRESQLDLEIATLEKEIEVASSISTVMTEDIRHLEKDVKNHWSKMQLCKAFRLCIEKDFKKVQELLRNLDTALLRFPNAAENLNQARLVQDIQDAVDRLYTYYENSSNVRSDKHKSVHDKLKEMVKTYRTDQYLNALLKSAAERKELCVQEEDTTETEITKTQMETCLDHLRDSHKHAFFATLSRHNKVQALQGERNELVAKLKENVLLNPNASQLQNFYEHKLRKFQDQEIIKSMSSLELPGGMQRLDTSEVEAAKHKIEQKEKQVITNYQQILKLMHANKIAVEAIRETLKGSDEMPNDSLIKSKLQQSALKVKDINTNLKEIVEQLLCLEVLDEDVDDLCVRPGKKQMAVSVKKELQLALLMPQEMAPEALATNVLQSYEDNNHNNSSLRLQEEVANHLQVEDWLRHAEDVLKVVLNADKMSEDVIAKAHALLNKLDRLVPYQKLKESLNDYVKQPAFNENIVK